MPTLEGILGSVLFGVMVVLLFPVGLIYQVYDRLEDRRFERTASEYRAMERFGFCVCGPDGTVDWDPRPHKHGGYFMHPSCNRDGWNGHRYRSSK
jgi:hypothetical protein